MKNKRYKQATFFDTGENQLSKYFDKNKVARNIVVYSCLSGCCNQRDLASFFKGRLDHG